MQDVLFRPLPSPSFLHAPRGSATLSLLPSSSYLSSPPRPCCSHLSTLLNPLPFSLSSLDFLLARRNSCTSQIRCGRQISESRNRQLFVTATSEEKFCRHEHSLSGWGETSWGGACNYNNKIMRMLGLSFRSNAVPAAGANASSSFPSVASWAEEEKDEAEGSDFDEKVARFWAWLVESGAASEDKTAVRPARIGGPGGESRRLGLVAQRHVSAGEEAVAVPEELIMSLAKACSSEIGEFCSEVRPWAALALFILYEISKGTDSKWGPYLDILPRTLHSPLFWSEEELQELEGTQLLGTVQAYGDFVREEFARIEEEILRPNPTLFPPTAFNLPSFLWAFGIVRSRSFPPLSQESVALVPFADLVNHGNGEVGSSGKDEVKFEAKKWGGLFGKSSMIVLKTGRAFSPGDEVVGEYSRTKSNAELALDYGFVDILSGKLGEEKNARESFTLTLEISQSDRFFDDKADILEINKLSTTASFDVTFAGGIPDGLLTYLRLVALGGADSFLLESLFRSAVWGHLGLPVSRENEEAICRAMIDGCSAALSSFPTSVDQDSRRLLGGDLGIREEIAVVVRMGEKRILMELLEWFEARLEALDSLEYYAERRLRDLGLLDETGDMTPWVSM